MLELNAAKKVIPCMWDIDSLKSNSQVIFSPKFIVNLASDLLCDESVQDFLVKQHPTHKFRGKSK